MKFVRSIERKHDECTVTEVVSVIFGLVAGGLWVNLGWGAMFGNEDWGPAIFWLITWRFLFEDARRERRGNP